MNFMLIDEEFAFKQSLYAIYDLKEEFDYKYILAILNSKFYSFIQANFNTSVQRDDFPKFCLKDYKEFLMPAVSKEQQQPIIELVNQILSIRKENPATDTSNLERKIDGLYGLTEEEIAIVEK